MKTLIKNHGYLWFALFIVTLVALVVVGLGERGEKPAQTGSKAGDKASNNTGSKTRDMTGTKIKPAVETPKNPNTVAVQLAQKVDSSDLNYGIYEGFITDVSSGLAVILESSSHKGCVIGEVTPLAYAHKSEYRYCTTIIWEELIVRASWKSKDGKDEWFLGYIYRRADPESRFKRKWEHLVQGQFWHKIFTKKPTETEIIAFAGETNFGNNEMYPEMGIHSIISYLDAPAFIAALQKGLSAKEREKRLSKFENMIMDPLW